MPSWRNKPAARRRRYNARHTKLKMKCFATWLLSLLLLGQAGTALASTAVWRDEVTRGYKPGWAQLGTADYPLATLRANCIYLNGTNLITLLAAGGAGLNGTNGVNGTNGAPGATGATGAAGSNGTNGTNGVNGINGTNGASFDPTVLSNIVAAAIANYNSTGRLWQASSPNLTNWAAVPTNSYIAATDGRVVNALTNPLVFQPADADLTNFAQLPTNSFIAATDGRVINAITNPATFQVASANLTNWSLLPTNSHVAATDGRVINALTNPATFQPTNATLTFFALSDSNFYAPSNIVANMINATNISAAHTNLIKSVASRLGTLVVSNGISMRTNAAAPAPVAGFVTLNASNLSLTFSRTTSTNLVVP